jgi:selenophosphate synthetase-related protein
VTPEPAGRDALSSIAARFATHPGIRAKAALRVVGEILGKGSVEGPGDDAAAIPSDGAWLLAAAEAMWPPFVEADPHGAGVASVVANVNDIAAMGGRVVAIADTVVAPEPAAALVLEGMRLACEVYGVRIVGGHLSVWSGAPAVSAFALGRATQLLSSLHVEAGQTVLLASCLEGRLRQDFPFFSSIAERAGSLAGDVEVLPRLAEAGHCVAAKDVSMAGLLGSLGMLLESTGSGAVVNLEAIATPPGVDLETWVFAFPTYGFLLTAAAERVDDCRAAFAERGLECAVIGTVDATGSLRVRLGAEEAPLVDLRTSGVTGLGPAGA